VTRWIFLLIHATGAITDFLFSKSSGVVAKIRPPWWANFSFPERNEASEKAQYVSWSGAIGTVINETLLLLASYKTLFALTMSPTVARGTQD
jgi:hypothetical protein